MTLEADDANQLAVGEHRRDELARLTVVKGPVNARTAAELGRIRLTGSSDTIPTLAEVLDLIAGRGMTRSIGAGAALRCACQ